MFSKYDIATADLQRADISPDTLARTVAPAGSVPESASEMFAAYLQHMQRKNVRYRITPFNLTAKSQQQIVPENLARKALIVFNAESTQTEISFDQGPMTPPVVLSGLPWELQTLAVGSSWRAITYGGGLFAAVAVNGVGNRVATSPDGVNWTSHASTMDVSWISIAYGAGTFVAVSNSNDMMTSTDGITWIDVPPVVAAQWRGITFGGGQFVVVGDGADIITSPDGITWTPQTGIAGIAWQDVCYGGGLYVAVGNTGTGMDVQTSPDGINWTQQVTPGTNAWFAIAYSPTLNLFAAVSTNAITPGQVMTSTDGVTWTQRVTPTPANNYKSIAFGGGTFVALESAGGGDADHVSMTSADGVTWTNHQGYSELPAANFWFGIAYGAGKFVAAGAGNPSAFDSIMTSTSPTSGNGNPDLPASINFVLPANDIKQFFHPPKNALTIIARDNPASGIILEGFQT